MSYADAVRFLGAKESPFLGVLDRILGGALLSGVTFGLSDLLGWFDAKVEFIRYSHELLVKAAELRNGLSRYDRTERVEAAHAVIVVVAFFEALDESKLPVTVRELGITRKAQLTLVGLTDLFDSPWPLPTPDRTYGDVLSQLSFQYANSASALLEVIKAHSLWDELDDTGQRRLTGDVRLLGDLAIRKYEQLLRRMMGDYPELQFWFQLRDQLASSAALERIETSLRGVLVGSAPDTRRAELAKKYRAVLDRPIVDSDEALPGLNIPRVSEAYVDPDFQVAVMTSVATPAVLSWWNRVGIRSDLYRYLVGYFTSPKAVRLPLLVLGDPGSGKSMLTSVLAARLPASDFLVVRVELRTAPVDGDLLDQIEHGLRDAVQENLGWAELIRSAGGTLPVVLLDGFDELLQATGVSQTRYLQKVVQFQRDRAEAGCPVAVVVTSRISVCGGIHIPYDTDVLRLAQFNADQVTTWLSTWNTANREYFAREQLVPLPTQVVLALGDIALQPLLLLMLALYDAVGNALQRSQGGLSKSQLYERLLSRFARREVAKNDADRNDQDLNADVEAELERLSVVAFGMFNRGAQWVSEADLNDDFAGLQGAQHRDRRRGMRTPLSAGETAIGRFFFVQRAEAVRDAQTLRTYEFLHATFGEFLVARFTWQVLDELAQVERHRPSRHAEGNLDDSELYALLSFTPLSSRRPAIDFLVEMVADSAGGPALADLVKKIFEASQEQHLRSRTDYEPVRHPVPTRYAIYSLNLVLLAVIFRDPLDVRFLGVADWQQQAVFWQSQLASAEWANLLQVLDLVWAPNTSVVLSVRQRVTVEPVDMGWLRPRPTFAESALEPHFTTDRTANLFRYALEPYFAAETHVVFARAVAELAVPAVSRSARNDLYASLASRFAGLVLDHLKIDRTADLSTFQALVTTPVGTTEAFAALLYGRVGHGGPQLEYLRLVGDLWKRGGGPGVTPIALLDAWLRLYEGGFDFSTQDVLPDLPRLLTLVDIDAIGELRPDLVKRSRYALADLSDPVDDLRDLRGPGTQAMSMSGVRAELPERTERVPATSAEVAGTRSVQEPRRDQPTWQDQLRELDERLASGSVSADDYRVIRDEILSSAVTGGPPARS